MGPMVPALKGIIEDKKQNIALLEDLKKIIADENKDETSKPFEDVKRHFPNLFLYTCTSSTTKTKGIPKKLNEMVDTKKLNELVQFLPNELKKREAELNDLI